MPANWESLSLDRRDRHRTGRLLAQGNLLDVLDQSERLVLVAPEFRRITARRDELTAAVFFVNDIAASIAQRRLQHINNEFGPCRSARRGGAQFRTELMLLFRFGK